MHAGRMIPGDDERRRRVPGEFFHGMMPDAATQSLMRLDNGVQSGSYSRELLLRDLPSGVYLLRMQVGEESRMMKIVRQ